MPTKFAMFEKFRAAVRGYTGDPTASAGIFRLKYSVSPRLNMYCGSFAADLPPTSSKLRTVFD